MARSTEELINEATDWAVAHGLLMQSKERDGFYEHTPMTLEATPFPQGQYIRAVEIAAAFNTLVESVSQQPDWLLDTLKAVEKQDEFTARLTSLLREVVSMGEKQSIHLGLHRSDYMLHLPEGADQLEMRQVELNTIASSFGSLSSKVTALHKHILALHRPSPFLGTVPDNDSLSGLARAICLAHKEYIKLRPESSQGQGLSAARILFVVQPGERNVLDQRLLEYQIAAESANEPSGRFHCLRATLKQVASFGSAATESCAKGPAEVLRFKGHEVSVAYFRAGYTPDDYPTEVEWQGRALIEHSFAIKCPCVAYHLAGTKKVQQQLAREGELERFVKPPDALALRAVFAGLYGLDLKQRTDEAEPEQLDESATAAVAEAKARPHDFVLKPQREGGGNNLFGAELKEALETWSPALLATHILMEKINPPTVQSTLIRNGSVSSGESVVELGLFGVFLGNSSRQLLSEPGGHLLRAKLSGVDEGGVAAGYAVLSSPLLVEDRLLVDSLATQGKGADGAAQGKAGEEPDPPRLKRQCTEF